MQSSDPIVALKEWASVIEALRTGRQILIMRKGGIREETKDFQVESDSFYLYPTYEHQKKELIKAEFQPQVDDSLKGWSSEDAASTITCYAELADDILIDSQEQLDKLRALHIWTDRFAEERLKWKKSKPLHVMLLRIYELEEPVRIDILPEYIGCKSWIGLPRQAFDKARRKQVLSEDRFRTEVSKVRSALKT